MRLQSDISYGPHREQLIDLYLPDAPVPSLVIFLHGGGWTHGSKRNGRHIGASLTQANYAVASIGYRLLPDVPARRLVQDCADGVAHVLHHAKTLGVDGRRFVLFGHSAGGHLCALLASDPAYLRRAGATAERLAGVLALDGIFDLSSTQLDRHMRAAGVALGGAGAKLSFSPVHVVAGMTGNPSFLLLYGERPQYAEQAETFDAALRQQGRTVARHMVPRLSHMEMTTHFGMSGTAMESVVLAWLAHALREPAL